VIVVVVLEFLGFLIPVQLTNERIADERTNELFAVVLEADEIAAAALLGAWCMDLPFC